MVLMAFVKERIKDESEKKRVEFEKGHDGHPKGLQGSLHFGNLKNHIFPQVKDTWYIKCNNHSTEVYF